MQKIADIWRSKGIILYIYLVETIYSLGFLYISSLATWSVFAQRDVGRVGGEMIVSVCVCVFECSMFVSLNANSH